MFCMAVSPASAAIFVTAEETKEGVLFSFEGSLDVTEMEAELTLRDSRKMINASLGAIMFGGYDSMLFYVDAMSLPAFGTSGDIYADSEEGDDLWLYSEEKIGVYSGYQSGDPLSGSMLFEGYNFNTLGVIPGVYEAEMPRNKITLTIGADAVPSPVPLPASLPLMLAGIGALGFARRRKA